MRSAPAIIGVDFASFVACEKIVAVPKAAEMPILQAEKAKPFERFDGCRLIPNRWNDGDSFHVRLPEAREIVARLYFVDTIESETAYRDRIAEQAAYFGITTAEAVTVAREASAFTAKRLSGPFSLWTRWRDALGRSAGGRVRAGIPGLKETAPAATTLTLCTKFPCSALTGKERRPSPLVIMRSGFALARSARNH